MSARVIGIPELFLERPCDRKLLAVYPQDQGGEAAAKASMLSVWLDFARHRETTRMIPLDPAGRASSIDVLDLERVIGWRGERGGFVELALSTGFLKLVAMGESTGEMLPADFRACSVAGGSATSAQRRGAMVTGRKSAEKFAARDVEQTFDLFSRTKPEILADLDPARAKKAMQLIRQVCRIMRWQPPVQDAWTAELLRTADGILSSRSTEDIDARLEWFVDVRGRDELPGRIDLLLKEWNDLPPIE